MSSALSLSVSSVTEKEEEEEEEEVRLIKVVEYVESPMCEELLCKFADTSAFDFDHTQSSIWSPLVPRPHRSLVNFNWELGTTPPPPKLGLNKTTFKNLTTNLKNNIFTIFKKQQKTKKKKRRTSFIKPSTTPPSTKGWGKVLRAASKHFKKKKKKKDPTLHVKLFNYSRQADDS